MAYDLPQIEENARYIKHRIAEAAQKSGRDPSEITFCAACKTQPAELLRRTADFGFDAFGENRAQELKANHTAGAYGSKPVHFIGHLQTNKVKDVVGRCELIHSVDSVKLLQAINNEAEKRNITQNVLIEVNIGGESNKSGVKTGEIESLLLSCANYPRVFVKGMMGIPPKVASFSGNTAFFERIYSIFIDIKAKKYDNVTMCCMSMGMSADYYDAILHGATIVRIGSELFGPRI